MKTNILITIIFILLFNQTAYTQGVVCENLTIESTGNIQSIGEKLIKKNNVTGNNFNKIKVFITYKTIKSKTFIYVYSNYKKPGKKYPTKILYNIDEIGLDIYDYCVNLVFDELYYPKTDELSLLLENAINSDIIFYIDNRIFFHSKLKNIDLKNAQNIKLVNKNGHLISNGYEVLKYQTELKKIGFYKGNLDGLKGRKTNSALLNYKKLIKVEKYKVEFKFNRKSYKVKFKSEDDFIKYVDESNELCDLEFCITNNGELSAIGSCGGVSIDISTKGKLKLTLTDGKDSYDFEIIKGKKVVSNKGCLLEEKICFSKNIKTNQNIIKCGENSIEISLNGNIKLSSRNFSTTF